MLTFDRLKLGSRPTKRRLGCRRVTWAMPKSILQQERVMRGDGETPKGPRKLHSFGGRVGGGGHKVCESAAEKLQLQNAVELA